MIGGIVTSLAQIIPELAIRDRDAKAAAKAAIAAAVGGALAPIDPLALPAGLLLASKEGVATQIDDAAAGSAAGAGFDLAADGIGGSPIALLQKAIGAGVGGGVATAGGHEDIGGAMVAGAEIASGRMDRVGAQASLALIAGGGAAAAADPEQRGDAFLFGAQLGTSFGGGVADLHSTAESIAEERVLSRSIVEDGIAIEQLGEMIDAAAIDEARAKALSRIIVEGASIAAAGFVYALAEAEEERAGISSARAAHAIAGSGLRLVQANGVGFAVEGARLAGAAVGAAAEVTIEPERRRARARAEEGDEQAARALERIGDLSRVVSLSGAALSRAGGAAGSLAATEWRVHEWWLSGAEVQQRKV